MMFHVCCDFMIQFTVLFVGCGGLNVALIVACPVDAQLWYRYGDSHGYHICLHFDQHCEPPTHCKVKHTWHLYS